MSDEKPKIIVDEDWKSQVEAERAAANSENAAPSSSEEPSAGAKPSDPPMPPASFSMLVSSLATEAMISLGQMPHPVTGDVVPRRNQAKYLIDTIEMLHSKTLGNVAAEESTGVEQLLHQLRMAFVAMPKSSEAQSSPAQE